MSIISGFCDVSNPLFRLVSALLLYSEIAHPQATTSEHGHLELHGNGRLLPRLLSFGLGQVGDGRQNLLLVALKLFDSPENSRFIRLVFAFAAACRKHLHLRRVRRHRYLYHHIVCIISALEYRANLDRVFNSSIVRVLLDYRCYFERQVDVLAYAIRHDFEEAVGWNECY